MNCLSFNSLVNQDITNLDIRKSTAVPLSTKNQKPQLQNLPTGVSSSSKNDFYKSRNVRSSTQTGNLISKKVNSKQSALSLNNSLRAASDMKKTNNLVKGLIEQINDYKGVLPETKNFNKKVDKMVKVVNKFEEICLKRVDFITNFRQEQRSE